MGRSLIWTLCLGLATAGGPVRAQGGSLVAEPVQIPGLSAAGGLEVLTAAADPRHRGLIVVDRQSEGLHLLPWDGPARRLSALESAPGSFGRPLDLIATAQRLLVVRRQPAAISVYDGELELLGDLPRQLYGPHGMALLGSRLFRIDSPVVAPPGTPARWSDRKWIRKHRRDDCRLFHVDLKSRELRQEPLVCGAELDSPTGRILPGGDLVAGVDGRRLYAVLGASHHLYVFASGGTLLHKTSYLEDGESFPAFTPADEQGQYASREAAMALRDRFPWFVGLLRWQAEIGLVFRVVDEGGSRLVVDLFDRDGKKLADDLDPGLPLRGYWDHAVLIELSDGRAMVLAKERSATGAVLSQRLFELKIERPPEASARPARPLSPGELRFRLFDGTSGAPVELTKLVAKRGKRTVLRDLQSAGGEYLETGLGAGHLRLRLEAPGYLPAALEVDLTQGTDLGDLFLDPGGSVRATLIHTETGAPLRDALVTQIRRHPWGALAADHFGFHNRARTNADGAFVLTGLEAGPACLRVAHAELPETALPIDPIADGESKELGTVGLGAWSDLTGRITDGAGQPLSAAVELRAGSLRDPCLRRRTATGTDGELRFERVAAGSYRLAVLVQQQIVASRPIEVPGTGEVTDLGTVETQVRPISGTVHLAGEAMRRDWVTIEPADPTSAPIMPVFVRGQGERQTLISDLGPRLTALPGDDGAFSTRGYLAAGPAIATYRAPDGTMFRQLLAVPPDGARVAFALDFRGVDIRGWVTAEDGAPADGASVELVAGNLPIRQAHADRQGGFRLSQVPPGSYLLRASVGETAASLPFPVGTSSPAPAELVLRTGTTASVELEVLSASGSAPRATVLLTGDSGPPRVRSGHGRIRFPGLPEGRYQAIVFAAGGLSTSEVFAVRTAQDRTVRLELGELYRVDALAAEEQAGTAVSLETADGFTLAPLLHHLAWRLEVGLDGRVELPPLARGTWHLRLHLRLETGPSPLRRAFEARPDAGTIELR